MELQRRLNNRETRIGVSDIGSFASSRSGTRAGESPGTSMVGGPAGFVDNDRMRYRLRAFGMHVLGSAAILSLVLGTLYVGWYHWPGWYLARAQDVFLVMVAVDLVLGPLLTGVIASPAKPRRELVRDVAVIVAVQLAALGYGGVQLWRGRPLYYAYSENVLQVVQAYDLDPKEADAACAAGLAFCPRWFSMPRWIWAPLPQDPKIAHEIVDSAIHGGADVVAMPRYFQPWHSGLGALRAQLKLVDALNYFSPRQKQTLAAAMRAAGLATETANAIPLIGRGHPLLAVFDPPTLSLSGFFSAD